jgi:hypothetical protein
VGSCSPRCGDVEVIGCNDDARLLLGMGFGLADFVKVRDGTSSSSPGCPSASASGNPGGMETREKSGDSQNSASPAATWTRRFEGKTTFCRDTGVNLNIHVLASISLVMTELHFDWCCGRVRLTSVLQCLLRP